MRAPAEVYPGRDAASLRRGQQRYGNRWLIRSQPASFRMMIVNFLRVAGRRVPGARLVGAE